MVTGSKQPKIGLALGAGGARGLAHIGVLAVLSEANIPISCLAGSSIGALVASLYACGYSANQIHQFLSGFPLRYWLDYTIPKLGFFAGERAKEIIRMLTKQKKIEESNLPLAIVATNLSAGQRHVFTKGSIAEAVRASISIPGIFVPEKINGEYYIDGGVTDRVPVSVLKEMDADLIIAVDVSDHHGKYPIVSIFDVIAQTIDIMEKEIVELRMLEADLILKPNVQNYSTMMFSRISDIVFEGEKCAQENLSKIQEIICKWKEQAKHEEDRAE